MDPGGLRPRDAHGTAAACWACCWSPASARCNACGQHDADDAGSRRTSSAPLHSAYAARWIIHLRHAEPGRQSDQRHHARQERTAQIAKGFSTARTTGVNIQLRDGQVWLSRRPHKAKIKGSNPFPATT